MQECHTLRLLDWLADKVTWMSNNMANNALLKLDDSDIPGVSLNKDLEDAFRGAEKVAGVSWS